MYLPILSSVEALPARKIGYLRQARGFLFVTLGPAWFALVLTARAVTPAPDGGYAGHNTAEGDLALLKLTSGLSNTAIGFQALYFNTTGDQNTAIGIDALYSNTDGSDNTAIGAEALISNMTGSGNVATGLRALYRNVSGDDNTATGPQALFLNSTGSYNTATGGRALVSNKSGSYNTANGVDALYSNTGTNNTANGASALFSNTSGGNNIASGGQALYSNTTGYYNTADGVFALYHNTVGHDNTGNGNQTLFNNTSGNFNTALGNGAGYNLTTGSNNIFIGANVVGAPGDANKIRIGKQGTQTATYIAGIYGKTVASGTGVAAFIDSTGKLGTALSSARYKEAIKPMNKASEALLQLEPVTFRYKQELDPDGVTQFGLVAEQVEKVNSDLVVRDEDGKVSTVRYEAINAMLLNEFLKQHRKMEEQQATIVELKSGVAYQAATSSKQEALIEHQEKQIEALAAGLEKVSDRVELSKTPSQLVAND